MKRVQVRWHTTAVTYYEAVFEVPDDFDPEYDHEQEPNFWDGNCSTLIEHEDRAHKQHGLYFDEFTREADLVKVEDE